MPIACFAEHREEGGQLWLRGLVGQPDGSRILRAEAEAPVEEAERLGQEVGQALLEKGAGEILADVYGNS